MGEMFGRDILRIRHKYPKLPSNDPLKLIPIFDRRKGPFLVCHGQREETRVLKIPVSLWSNSWVSPWVGFPAPLSDHVSYTL